MKESFYFSHDFNARSDTKIQKLLAKKGYLGYGLFWAIIEDLYNNDNRLEIDYDVLSFHYRTDADTIKSIVNDFDLFLFDGSFFYSKSIQDRLDKRHDKSQKAKDNAMKRWGESESRVKADSSIFYVLRFYGDEEEFLKCGITTESISRRFSGKTAKYSYEVLFQSEMDLKDSLELENMVSIKCESYLPKQSFGGSLECYGISEKSKILKLAMPSECKGNAIKESKVKEIKTNDILNEDSHNEIFRTLWKSNIWLEQRAIENKVGIPEVLSHLNRFRIECIGKDDLKVSEKDAKSHFMNWIKRGNPFPEILGKSTILLTESKTKDRNPQ